MKKISVSDLEGLNKRGAGVSPVQGANLNATADAVAARGAAANGGGDEEPPVATFYMYEVIVTPDPDPDPDPDPWQGGGGGDGGATLPNDDPPFYGYSNGYHPYYGSYYGGVYRGYAEPEGYYVENQEPEESDGERKIDFVPPELVENGWCALAVIAHKKGVTIKQLLVEIDLYLYQKYPGDGRRHDYYKAIKDNVPHGANYMYMSKTGQSKWRSIHFAVVGASRGGIGEALLSELEKHFGVSSNAGNVYMGGVPVSDVVAAIDEGSPYYTKKKQSTNGDFVNEHDVIIYGYGYISQPFQVVYYLYWDTVLGHKVYNL